MVRIDALKVLSSETRCTLFLRYTPSQEIKHAFLLPSELSIVVEVFPVSDISIFAQSEPLFYADGYLVMEEGAPAVISCPGTSFCEESYLPTKCAERYAFDSGVQTAVEHSLNSLVSTARRKAEKACFEVKRGECARLCVFLVKIGRVCAAFDAVREACSREPNAKGILSYLIYSVYCSLVLPKEKDAALDKATALSSSLDGSLSSVSEDRVLACILAAFLHCKDKTSDALSFYTRIKVSNKKKALFFYLLAECMGPMHCGVRSAILTLSEEASMCNKCTYRQTHSTNKVLRSMRAVSSSINIERPPYDFLLDQYMHGSSSVPDIHLSISTDAEKNAVEVKRNSKENISFLAHEKIFISASHEVQVRSLLIECSLASSFVLKEKNVTFEKKDRTLVLSSSFSENTHVFILPYSTRISEINIEHKGRILALKCCVSIEILSSTCSKHIYSHKYSIMPVILMQNRPIHESVSKYISKYAGVPCSLSSLNRSMPFPFSVNIPFTHNETLLHKSVFLYWIVLPIAQIIDKDDYITIKALDHDLVLGREKKTELFSDKEIRFQRQKLKKLFWCLRSQSKRGVFIF